MSVFRKRATGADERDLLSRYIREIGKYSLLTPEQEKELGRRIRDGDEEAVRRLVEANLRFVVSYSKRYRGMGLSLLDLIHEGNLGLIEAARRFDPEKNVKFITYGVWWVRQAMLQALSEHTRAFAVPSRLAGAIGRLSTEFNAESAEGGTRPPEEVAASLDLSVEDVNALIAILGEDVSLSDTMGEDYDQELADRLEQETVPPVDLVLMRDAFLAQVRGLLNELTDKEAEVLKLRFGLDGGEALTLQEIGDKLQLSRERIRQIESRAMSKLRRSGNAQALRGSLN